MIDKADVEAWIWFVEAAVLCQLPHPGLSGSGLSFITFAGTESLDVILKSAQT